MATNGPGPLFKAGSIRKALRKAVGTTPNVPATASRSNITDLSKPAAVTIDSATPDSVLSKKESGIDKAIPYLSNAINALRKPPAPIRGKNVSAPGLRKVDFSQERAEVDRDVRSANLAASTALDSQGAAAVAGANIAKGFEARSASYGRETNANTQIENQGAQLRFQADMINAGKEDQYNQDSIAMKLAHQREQSQNLANAADKRVAEVNNNAARELEGKKFNVLADLYSNGIVDRLTTRVVDRNQKTTNAALGLKNGGQMRKVYASGGTLGGEDPVKPAPAVYKTQADVDKANAFAKEFANRKFSDGRGAVNPDDTYVATKPGDPAVQFLDAKTGKPFVDTAASRPKAFNVPNYVNLEDIQGDGANYWYEDRDGKMVDVDSSVLNLKRFRKPAPTAEVAKLGMGGKIGGGIGRAGRIRKVY